ncbi:flavodoxin domain-containing protein [Chitinophagaceae bacterium 26-R-25]|nr:flavodoxin domain-containing protein [Chitinophagaceae bacterium 26-R-25]
MPGLIIYTSKYGATQQYAEWLGEMLQLTVKPSTDITEEELSKYDFILLGTPVYFGTFKLKAWLVHNVRYLLHKKLFFFIVSATGSQDKEICARFIEQNVPAELKPYCQFYFLPGQVIHQRLSFRDKLILKLVAGVQRDPEKRKALNEDLIGVKKEELASLINDTLISVKG